MQSDSKDSLKTQTYIPLIWILAGFHCQTDSQTWS